MGDRFLRPTRVYQFDLIPRLVFRLLRGSYSLNEKFVVLTCDHDSDAIAPVFNTKLVSASIVPNPDSLPVSLG